MTVHLAQADALRIPLPDESVHCVVTSPPYFGLRDYGTATWEGGDPECDHIDPQGPVNAPSDKSTLTTNNGKGPQPGDKYHSSASAQYRDACPKCGAIRHDPQIGLEETPEQYIDKLVRVFREVRRVLRADGVCFLNLGDSYQDKQLLMIPARVALALQADGWWVRSAPWLKSNAMPESVTDRPTTAHELVFLLSKSARYFYDGDAVREELSPTASYGGTYHKQGKLDKSRNDHNSLCYPGKTILPNPAGRNRRTTDFFFESLDAYIAHLQHFRDEGGMLQDLHTGLPVAFNVSTKPYKGAHFATFPPDLVEPCIKAGTSERGVCPDCGAPWERVVERVTATPGQRPGYNRDCGARNDGDRAGHWVDAKSTTTGWRPTCDHDADLEPGDLEIINTPTGSRVGADPTMTTGRAGYNRPRGDNEGQRPITRYEQRRYAEQLKQSPHREAMAAEVGESTFAHYIRTDRSGARPVPPDILDDWIRRGWLTREEVPDVNVLDPVPATVLDPFAGSGTVGVVARKLGRRAVLLDISHEYLSDQARARLDLDKLQAWESGTGHRDAGVESFDELPLFGGA